MPCNSINVNALPTTCLQAERSRADIDEQAEFSQKARTSSGADPSPALRSRVNSVINVKKIEVSAGTAGGDQVDQ